jgi:hypothetical protein
MQRERALHNKGKTQSTVLRGLVPLSTYSIPEARVVYIQLQAPDNIEQAN